RNVSMRFGKPPPPRRTGPPAPPLATGSATASTRASARSPTKSNSRSGSSVSPLVLVQKTPQLMQLFLGRPPALQRVDHQFACRTLKHALQDVANELALGLRRWLACLINVGTLLFVSAHGTLGSHNLQQLQHRGVPEVLLLAQLFMDFADRGRPALPQHSQDFQLRRSWLLQLFVRHARSIIRRFSYCQRKSSYFLLSPLGWFLALPRRAECFLDGL